MPPRVLVLDTHTSSPLPMCAHGGQHRAVDALGSQDVHVVKVRELFGGESFRRAEHHVAGIVDQDIQTAFGVEDGLEGRVRRGLRGHVEFDGAQIDLMLGGKLLRRFNLGGVPAFDIEHARVNDVTRLGQSPGRECAEAAGRAGDQNNFFCGSHRMEKQAPVSRGSQCSILSFVVSLLGTEICFPEVCRNEWVVHGHERRWRGRERWQSPR